MKVKLYKKYVKRVCRCLGITRKQLFSRRFETKIIYHWKYDIDNRKFVKVDSLISCVDDMHPLSQLWKVSDMHSAWLMKYWKYSHYKYYIQAQIDLGLSEFDAVKSELRGGLLEK